MRDLYYDHICRMSDDRTLSAFRAVPRTGVIYVTTEAAQPRLPRRRSRRGATSARASPRPAPLPGAPPRVAATSRIDVDDQEYAPVAGLWELREAIADLYNRLYRRGHAVAVHAPRTSASRAAGARRSRAPRPASATSTSATSCPTTPPTRSCSTSSRRSPPSRSCSRASAATPSPPTICAARCTGRGLSALLLSNPCNPTGKLVRGDELGALGRASARELDCALLLDEFYSHYVWTGRPGQLPGRERGALRRGRRPRSGGASSTASPRTGATPAGASPGRSGPRRSSRRSPAPARSSTAAARSRCSARRSRCSRTRTWSPRRSAIHAAFRDKRDRMLAGLERARRAHRPRARRHVLRLGQGRRAAAAARRRHGLLPRRARAAR